MNLFGVMDISASALKAERVRAEVVAANMANADTTRGVDGKPYQRQHVVFSAAGAPATDFRTSLMSQANFSIPSIGSMSGSMTADTATPGGVQIAGVVSDNADPQQRYEPSNPDADTNGFVSYPDINPLTEMVDLMGASRAYGANASAIQAEKNMLSASLEILK
jgi:flagellar basal-body rod protein FlgC